MEYIILKKTWNRNTSAAQSEQQGCAGGVKKGMAFRTHG